MSNKPQTRKCSCGGDIVFIEKCEQTVHPKFDENGNICETEVIDSSYNENEENVDLFCRKCGKSHGKGSY